MRSVIISSIIASGGAWSILFMLLKSRLAWRIAVDQPNQRSLHARAVPRVGGLAVVGIALVAMISTAPELEILTMITTVLAAVCAIDDRRGLSVLTRLTVQFVAATAASTTLMPSAPLWVLASSIVVIVWSMNLYNFMDGADGLAGGMAVFGFGAFAVASEAAGAREIALASACIGGAAAGFLPHNFPPAKVFLGDAGSIPLGFLAAAIGILGFSSELWPIWFPILVFSPFIVDATTTLVSRVLRGKRVWHAHREHLYQRMVTGGLGHARTMVAWYVVMAAAAISGVAAVWWPIHLQIALLVVWTALYCAIYVFLNRCAAFAKHEA